MDQLPEIMPPAAPASGVVEGEIVEKNPGGAPGWWEGKEGENRLEKLRTAYLYGCTDEEACLSADISLDQLYYYERTRPEFSKSKKLWKQNPVLIARSTVIKAMKDDKDLAFRFLERRKKDEFAPSATVHVEGAEKVDSAIAVLAQLTGQAHVEPLDGKRGEPSPPDGDVLQSEREAADRPAEVSTPVPSDPPPQAPAK